MRRRRGRGEGSVYKRADGRYSGYISLGYSVDGKKRRQYVYGKTKSEVLDALSKHRDAGRGGLPEPSKVKVGEFLEAWLDQVVSSKSASTYDLYRTQVRNRIKPAIGNLLLQKLTPARIADFYAALSHHEDAVKRRVDGRLVTVRKPVGAVTRASVRSVLHAALEHAVSLELIPRNPTAKIKAPPARRKPHKTLNLEQIDTYFAALPAHRLGALFVLAVLTTMREGELFGLQWSDVDFERGAIYVRHQWRRAHGGGYELGIVKTERSNRRIDLPPIAVRALRIHREQMNAEGQTTAFVFCSPAGTPLVRSNLLQREHYPLLKKLGLPRITFHELRHTAAEALNALGVHTKIVQERMGHTSYKTTSDTYQSSAPTLQKPAVDALESRFGKHFADSVFDSLSEQNGSN